MRQDDDKCSRCRSCRRRCYCTDSADRERVNPDVFGVVAVEADAVVRVVVAGIVSVDAHCVVNVVGAVLHSEKLEIQNCTTALTVFYFEYVYVNSAK